MAASGLMIYVPVAVALCAKPVDVAMALIVWVAETTIGLEYTAELVVGVFPLVV